jgi:predicted RNA-binding Zn-ribbon protein involved in translation (DUF1610 family)
MYRCPECGSDELEVTVETRAKLIQSDGNIETDTDAAEDACHEWGENSVMRCVSCRHSDIADEFRTESQNSA